MGDDRLMISESASKALFNLLSNSGTLRSRTLGQIHTRLIDVVNQLWEGGKVTRFTDGQGGGWLIDISRGFGDIMLYAVARSTEGVRAVVTVIDEAELEQMKGGGGAMPPEVDSEPEKPWAEGGKAKLPPVRDQEPTAPPPESPVLLRWVDRGPDPSDPERGMGKAGNGESWEDLELQYSEVGSKVQELISEGIDPSDIEIWTERKKPQVSVVLV